MNKPILNRARRRKRPFNARIRQRQYREIFDRIYNKYLEIRSVNGTMSCSKFYRTLGQVSRFAGARTGIVVVTASDFIADVELAARRSLTPAEFQKFRNEDINERIQEKVGRSFVLRKIHPLHLYLRPKEVK